MIAGTLRRIGKAPLYAALGLVGLLFGTSAGDCFGAATFSSGGSTILNPRPGTGVYSTYIPLAGYTEIHDIGIGRDDASPFASISLLEVTANFQSGMQMSSWYFNGGGTAYYVGSPTVTVTTQPKTYYYRPLLDPVYAPGFAGGGTPSRRDLMEQMIACEVFCDAALELRKNAGSLQGVARPPVATGLAPLRGPGTNVASIQRMVMVLMVDTNSTPPYFHQDEAYKFHTLM